MVKAAFNVEVTDPLGYTRQQDSIESNSRNSYSTKTAITDVGTF